MKVFARRFPYSLPAQVDQLALVDLKQLEANRIKGIILDLDNTIVSEDDRYVSPHAEQWIATAQQRGMQLFILSNGKRRHRVLYWRDRLNVPAMSPARKPFPFAFRRACRSMGLHPGQVVVIGDSWHTDLLGAWLVGASSIQVASLPHPARWWEKLFGHYVQVPYPLHLPLWKL